MAQQIINIGAALDDGTGDPLRLSFDKTNDNFTELYAKGATEGLWNYNKTSTDTSTTPVSGRFKTNSGNYRDATQIAIHAITIQGIDRTSTLRAMLVGDIVQCQDSTNSAAWCRYSLQSLPVDHGTWFQLNVALQTDGGVASGDNQEIVFGFTAGGGGGTAAPVGAEYITSTADATLTAERVLTDTATVTWDRTTAGQIKATAVGGGNVSNSGTPTVGQYAKWVTATTIQGVAPATVLSDIGAQPAGSYQPLDGELTAIAGLTSAADQAPYFTGSGAAALMTVTAAARTVLDDTTVGAMLTTMGGLSSATATTTYAPLASPTFTGDPKAPTPATADNDTSIATTAYVQAQGYLTSAAATAAYQPLDADLTAIAALAGTNTIYYRSAANTWSAVTVSTGLAFSGGNLTSTVTGGAPVGAEYITSTADATLTAERVLTDTATVTWDRTTAGQIKANAVASGGGTSAPQGRLTLQTATPVMTTTQAAKTTIYYTPYQGNLVPIYDGTNFSMSAFAELTALTTDTTKSPAAIGVSKVNDWFVWNDAGTLRLGHGPDWTSDTVRSAGTALVMVNGILLNNAAITNGPAASRGTYIGTTRSNASSQLDWIVGSAAVGGGAAVFGVWNCYNRIEVVTTVTETTATWTIAAASTGALNASNNNRVSAVFGLSEDGVLAMCNATAFVTTAGNAVACGVSLNTTATITGPYSSNFSSSYMTVWACLAITAPLGFNFFQAMQNNTTSGGGFSGSTSARTALEFMARM